MAMSRMQLKYRQMQAKYEADTKRPPTRAQARAWLQPLRDAFNEIRSGEVTCVEEVIEDGEGNVLEVKLHPATKMRWIDDDLARIDYSINGFLGMTDRLFPQLDVTPMRNVANKLTEGIDLTDKEVDTCFRLIGKFEDLLLTVSRQALKDASQTEMIRIELDRIAA